MPLVPIIWDELYAQKYPFPDFLEKDPLEEANFIKHGHLWHSIIFSSFNLHSST